MNKKFNEALMEYNDEFLANAYTELKYLSEKGAFHKDAKYFSELVDLRSKSYSCQKDIECTKKDLLNEIARRWAEEHEF